MHIILLGPPGSGKGSQAGLLSKKYKLENISVGNILREEAKKKTKLGREIKRIINKGDLVPCRLIINLIKKLIKNSRNLLLDGFPRDITEARALDKIIKIDYVFLLNIPDKIVIKRLSNRRICDCGMPYNLITKRPKRDLICDKCGRKIYRRDDDQPKIIKERLKVYKNETIPVINYYKNKNLLVELDGSRSIKSIFNKISSILDKKGLYK